MFCPLNSTMLHHGGDGAGAGSGPGSGSFPAFLWVKEHETASREYPFYSLSMVEICSRCRPNSDVWRAQNNIQNVLQVADMLSDQSEHSFFLWCWSWDYAVRSVVKHLNHFQPWRQTNSILDGGNCMKRIVSHWWNSIWNSSAVRRSCPE